MSIYQVRYKDDEALNAIPQEILVLADSYAAVEEIIEPYGYIKYIIEIRFLGALFNPPSTRTSQSSSSRNVNT